MTVDFCSAMTNASCRETFVLPLGGPSLADCRSLKGAPAQSVLPKESARCYRDSCLWPRAGFKCRFQTSLRLM